MREYVWLECTTCGERNYRVQKRPRGAERLELEEILPARAQAHAAQGIAKEVGTRPGRPASSARPAVPLRARLVPTGAPGTHGPDHDTSVAQLVEHRSPKPAVGGSIPSARALGRSGSAGARRGEDRGAVGGPAIPIDRACGTSQGVTPDEKKPQFPADPGLRPRLIDGLRTPRLRDRCPWAKSKTKCRRPSRRSPEGGTGRRPPSAASPISWPICPGRSLQTEARVVRPPLHGARLGCRLWSLGLWRLHETLKELTRWLLAVRRPPVVGLVLGLGDLPARAVPPVRRVPDRHRGRDEQGLVDQPRRPVPGDHGGPRDGLPDVGLPVRASTGSGRDLLQIIGVLKFGGGGGFGSNAG